MDARKAERAPLSAPSQDGFPASEIVMLAPGIEADAARCGGKPCIAGTRIRVADVLGFLAIGMPMAEIVRDYPSLTEESVRAACDYASRVLLAPVVFPADDRPSA